LNWSLVVSVAGVVLNALVIGFWKPWLSAYGGEKAKNLARKEDLNEILVEVRAVTSTQKEIEARISGDLWNRQAQRNEKKTVYGDLLMRIHEATRACQNLAHWRDFMSKGLHWEAPQFDMDATIRTELGNYEAAETELIRLAALVSIFARQDSSDLLTDYLKQNRRIDFASTVDVIKQQRNQLTSLSEQIVASAKVDLGITSP